MHFKVVLILAIVGQVTAGLLALRLNWKYRSHSAWVMISAAAWLIALQQVATLSIVWNVRQDIIQALPLWVSCLSALLVAVLYVGGVALVEPLFVQIAKARALLEREKQKLEEVVSETEEELQVAKKIQQRLLPTVAPDIPGFDVSGSCQPAAWTSGDYFDYIPLRDDSWLLVVADVTGHGIGPSLLSSSTRAVLRMLARTHSQPHEILTLANRTVSNDVEFGRFVTVFMGKLDSASRTFVYAGAGHDGYLLKGDGTSTLLKAQGPPLGASDESVFESSPSIKIEDDDILLLYSDGIYESEGPDAEQFGLDRMVQAVDRHRDKTATEIRVSLFQAVHDFIAGTPQHDDNTVVIVKATNRKVSTSSTGIVDAATKDNLHLR